MNRYAIYYENRLGRNDGNPLYVYSALKRRENLSVDHILPDPNGQQDLFGKYDAHIWVDWGEDGLTGILPYVPKYPPGRPLVYWASDTHISDASYSYRLECAKMADIVFVAQKRALEEFKRDGVKNPIWLPHAVEPLSYCDIDSVQFDGQKVAIGSPRPYEFASKTYDVCFVGHINTGNRIDFLDKMFKEFPNFYYGQRLFNEASEKYARSKISLNIAMTDDINMRCFEVMGSKGFLLTNWLPTIEEIGFKDGINCALYRSIDEAVDKARYYIQNDEKREEIANAGYQFAMDRHTIDHRVNAMIEEIERVISPSDVTVK